MQLILSVTYQTKKKAKDLSREHLLAVGESVPDGAIIGPDTEGVLCVLREPEAVDVEGPGLHLAGTLVQRDRARGALQQHLASGD